MAKKQSYSYKVRKNDTLTNRMLIVFLLLLVSVFALLSVRNWLDSSDSIASLPLYLKVAPFFPVVPLILFIVASIRFFMMKKKGVDETLTVFSSAFTLAIASVLLFVSLLISVFVFKGFVPAIIFIVLVSLLYFISVSFPGAYLGLTVFNTFAAFIIYMMHLLSPVDSRVWDVVLRVFFIVVALTLGFMLLIYKKSGKEFIKISFLNKDTNYLPLFLSIIQFIVFLVLGLFQIGSYVIFDIIIAFETIVFALFYAIKMLK
ncbi:MAG: hypothetical protein E7582_04860 [Ruminococcaceae bacterium]|nr:hypothetical protein [Oscillospiraceae bacterium]